MRITDEDRALAAELVELLTGDTNDRDVKCVAIVLAAHRGSEQGRCGVQPMFPVLTPAEAQVIHCDLPAGHLGWHRCGTTEWSREP